MLDSDAQMKREYERQEVARAAVQRADGILMDAKEGVELEKATIELLIQLSWLVNHHPQISHQKWEAETPKYIQDAAKAIIYEIHSAFPGEENQVVTRFIYFEVILMFAQKARCPFIRELNKWDMENPATSKRG